KETAFSADIPVDPTRLQDCPSWKYLLQEFDALYRMGFSGGSAIIRSHRKRVRDRLSNAVKSNPVILENLQHLCR
ncbi:MAG: hypothetical protein ABJT05_13330, partial [Paracoccaceae bacterium]